MERRGRIFTTKRHEITRGRIYHGVSRREEELHGEERRGSANNAKYTNKR